MCSVVDAPTNIASLYHHGCWSERFIFKYNDTLRAIDSVALKTANDDWFYSK
jgi:hypothetical protein